MGGLDNQNLVDNRKMWIVPYNQFYHFKDSPKTAFKMIFIVQIYKIVCLKVIRKPFIHILKYESDMMDHLFLIWYTRPFLPHFMECRSHSHFWLSLANLRCWYCQQGVGHQCQGPVVLEGVAQRGPPQQSQFFISLLGKINCPLLPYTGSNVCMLKCTCKQRTPKLQSESRKVGEAKQEFVFVKND